MSTSLGDNKKRLGGSASSLTEMKRRAVVGQTWNFSSKQPKLPSAGYITTVEAMTASTLAFENARNAGVVPRIHLIVAVPTASLTATEAVTAFAPVQIVSTVALSSTPVFSISPALPYNLSFSSSTGVISGTPMETITATTFTVTVTANSIYPTPVVASATFTLSVGDSATDLTYQGYSGTTTSGTLPTIDDVNTTKNGWGSRNDTFLANIRGGGANVIFSTDAVTPREEQVAVYFIGYFKAPVSGSYTFTYDSDDGFQWILDGTRLVNRPGSTTTNGGTTGALTLVANRYYATSGLWSQGGGPGFLSFSAITAGGSNIIGTYPIKTRFYH